MYIQSIKNIPLLNSHINNSYSNNKIMNKETGDVFEKRTVSFGSNNDEYLSQLIEKYKNEHNLSMFLKAMNDKKVFGLYKNNMRGVKIHDFIYRCNFKEDVNKNFLIEILTNNGVKSIQNLFDCTKNINANHKSRKIFDYQSIEAVEIYGKLNSKTYINRYPDILLQLYKDESYKENPNYDNLNKYTEFLNHIGIIDSDKFEEEYSYLKPDFNNFETAGDKVDAITYLMETHEDKINFIKSMLSENSDTIKQNPETAYRQFRNIFEYLYEQDSNYSYYAEDIDILSKYSPIMDIVLKSNKIKSSVLNNVAKDFNNFENPDDKLALFQLLKESGTTIDEFNKLAAKSIIEGSDPILNIIDKEDITQEIEAVSTNPQNAKVLYSKFSDLFGAIYENQNDSKEKTKNLIKITENYNIKNQSEFIQFYNNANGSRQKTITANELCNFIELFNYVDDKDILKTAKSKNTTAVSIMQNEKEKFLSKEKEINDFILTDDKNYFTGKTALEIYKEYKNSLEESDSVSDVLKNISEYGINNSDDYKQKLPIINQFAQYFPNKASVIEFISKSKITFGNTESEEEYRKNCLEILEILSKTQDAEKKITNLTESEFLPSSQMFLTEFLNGFASPENKQNTVNIIAQKKVPSLKKWNSFNKKYAAGLSYNQNIINFLQATPEDMTFKDITDNLLKLQQKIDKLNIPIKINAKNIMHISPAAQSEQDFCKTINKMMGVDENESFVRKLPKAFKDKKSSYTQYAVAHEIYEKHNSDKDPYKNLEKAFNLTEDLFKEDDESYYAMIDKIKEKIPDTFMNFINSNEWYSEKISSGKKFPNISTHAILRAIDRYALNSENIEDLYTEKSKKKLCNLFDMIYMQTPEKIKEAKQDSTSENSEKSPNILIEQFFDNEVMHSIFTNKGCLITVIKKDNYSSSI